MSYEKQPKRKLNLATLWPRLWRSRPQSWIGIGFIVVLLIMGCQLAPNSVNTSVASRQTNVQSLPIGAIAQVADTRLELEVAATPQQQATGLMNRTALADDKGMVFPFSPPRTIGFWMKNTLIPLDMIFLHNHKIVNIHRNVPPCKTANCPSYTSKQIADEVIELRAGRSAELGLEIGDRLIVEYL